MNFSFIIFFSAFAHIIEVLDILTVFLFICAVYKELVTPHLFLVHVGNDQVEYVHIDFKRVRKGKNNLWVKEGFNIFVSNKTSKYEEAIFYINTFYYNFSFSEK